MERPQLDILTSSSCVKDFRLTFFGNTLDHVQGRCFRFLIGAFRSYSHATCHWNPHQICMNYVIVSYFITQDNFIYLIKRTQSKKRSD